MEEQRLKRVSIEVHEDLHRQLKILAAKRGTSITELVLLGLAAVLQDEEEIEINLNK